MSLGTILKMSKGSNPKISVKKISSLSKNILISTFYFIFFVPKVDTLFMNLNSL